KFIRTWTIGARTPGALDAPHSIAVDSTGRVFVADREHNQIQIFSPDGRNISDWKQFGRPSSVAIDKDIIFVADSQSNNTNNPAFKQGIRIGSAIDGSVTSFVPAIQGHAPDTIAADEAGNVYAGWLGERRVVRFVKEAATTGAGPLGPGHLEAV